MISMLDTIDKYMKDSNIPFKSVSFNKCYLPWFINMAIIREVKKSSHIYFTGIASDYQLRYDKNGNLYLLISNERNRENFVIGKENILIKEDFKISGKNEKHIVKIGCLFKLLEEDIKRLDKEIEVNYSGLDTIEKERLRYELINDMLEDKYREFIRDDKIILDEVNYEDELIESTYKIMYYIRYLNELYNNDSLYNERSR